MATRPKRWPTNALWAKEDALAKIGEASDELEIVFKQNGDMDDLQELRHLVAVHRHLQDARWALENAP